MVKGEISDGRKIERVGFRKITLAAKWISIGFQENVIQIENIRRYFHKIDQRNLKKACSICSKLSVKVPDQC